MLSGHVTLNYSEKHNKTTKNTEDFSSERSLIEKQLDYNVMAGYSFGRIRNVTPVVRALRFNERIKEHSLFSELSPAQIQQVAKHFSKHSGYRQLYLRHNKYFWHDLQEIIDLPPMNMEEAFYLYDVFDEMIFDNYEGWSIDVGMNSTREYFKQDKVESDLAYYGPFIQFSWYHNLSLYRHLYLHASSTYNLKAVGDNKKYSKRFYYTAYAKHTWSIADRTIWQTTVGMDNQTVDIGYPTPLANDYLKIYFESSVQFLIEDHFTLSGNIDYTFQNSSRELLTGERKTTSHDLRYYLRFNYILVRSLK